MPIYRDYCVSIILSEVIDSSSYTIYKVERKSDVF